jgi:hypothetical protein
MDGDNQQISPVNPVTVNDIREAIGTLIILWSRTESEFRKALMELDPDTETLCASKAILRWQSLFMAAATSPKQISIGRRFIQRIDAARLFRNAICHNLDGYSVDPFGQGHPTGVYFTAKIKTIFTPYTDFQRIIADLASASFMLYRLTEATRDPEMTGKSDLLANVEADLDRVAAEHPETV